MSLSLNDSKFWFHAIFILLANQILPHSLNNTCFWLDRWNQLETIVIFKMFMIFSQQFKWRKDNKWFHVCYFFEFFPHTDKFYSLHLAPVPLSIFRSNSKFDENSECSGFEYTRPITMIFCTRHDSDTVVTCAKYRCDRPRIFYTRVFWVFIEFRIRSNYA